MRHALVHKQQCALGNDLCSTYHYLCYCVGDIIVHARTGRARSCYFVSRGGRVSRLGILKK